MNIREVQDKQFNWLKSVGWVGKTTQLEDMALVCSEIGEASAELHEGHPAQASLASLTQIVAKAINECRGEKPTDNFETELADIVLRVMGIASKNDIDLQSAIEKKMKVNLQRGTRGRKK